MHTKSMAESEGEFTKEETRERPCPKCGSKVRVRLWESSCGGYEDENHECANPACRYVVWVEGPDA